MKRKRPSASSPQAPDNNDDTPTPTPKKRRPQSPPNEPTGPTEVPITPVKRGRGRPPGSKNKPKPTPTLNGTPASQTRRKDVPQRVYETPTKSYARHYEDDDDDVPTPIPLIRNADRSAKRKSAQRLIERQVNNGGLSEDSDGQGAEDALARRIFEGQDAEEEDEGISDRLPSPAPPPNPATTDVAPPVRRGRSRPKGSTNKKRPPTPPPSSLPPHEAYFFQTRPSASTKTSSNTLSMLPSHLSLLTHEDYFALIGGSTDPHLPERRHLSDLHTRSFPQWQFELSQGFNVCLHGWGTKRPLATSFASFISTHSPLTRIAIINGYTSSLLPRDIFTLLSTLLHPSSPKLTGTQPAEMLSSLLSLLSLPTNAELKILVIIHSIDAPPLRHPNTQSLLSLLAAHPSVSLLATTTHPLFPLLWDGTVRQNYNFAFHDATTFAPYDAEVDVVGSVDELLGRSGRRVGGREGVGFVLRSLTGKARGLYRLLLGEILAHDGEGGGGEDDEEAEEGEGGSRNVEGEGVEYRVLYRKAVEEFIVGNEVAFRGMLKEFHDHQMITSRKDALGTELLSTPFRRGEMEGILEDLME